MDTNVMTEDAVNDGLLHYFPFRRHQYLDNLVVPGTPVTNVNVTKQQFTDRFGKANAAYMVNTTGIEIMTLPPGIMDDRGDFTLTIWIHYFRNFGNAISMARTGSDNEFTFNEGQMTFFQSGGCYYTIPQNQWSHVAFTRQGIYFRVYIDGVLADYTMGGTRNMKVEGFVLWNDQDQVLGGFQANNQYSGGFQDFRIYDRAKNVNEIQEIMNEIHCNSEDEFLDPMNRNLGCQSCVFPCVDCTSLTNCLTCAKYEANRHTEPNCTCFDRYYSDSTDNCVLCPERYGNCNNETSPISCRGNNRKGTTDDCQCLDRHFENPSNEHCEMCNYKCLSCNQTSVQCLTCSDANRSGGSCQCDPGFWDNGTDLCQPCNYPCGNCTDSSTCQSCATTPFRVSLTNCNCLPGYYDVDPTGCQRCNYPCHLCQSDGSTCISCRTLVQRVSLTNCTCNLGFYDNGSDCQACDRRCGTCQSNGVTCVQPCETNCGYCDISGKCIKCLIGFYLDQNMECIQQCHRKCIACSSQSTEHCILCAKGIGRSRDIQLQCGCMDGYYDDASRDCKPCKINGCRVCDLDGICTECMNKELDPQNCVQKLILLQKDQNGNLLCKIGQNRSTLYPCLCNFGYYNVLNSQDCKKCPQECKNCVSQDMCTQCVEDRILDKFTGQCECQKGFKEDQNGVCKPCYYYKGRCFYKCPDNSQINQELQICQQEKIFTTDKYIVIYVCWIVAFLIAVVLLFIMKQNFNQYEIKQPSRSQVKISHTQKTD